MSSYHPSELEPVSSNYFHLEQPFSFRSGEQLHGLGLAYEMYGALNAERSNAILLFHALSGSQHAYGYNDEVEGSGSYWCEELYEGWWQDFIGPGKVLDTSRYAIICANYLGGCYGSSGPHSINPANNKPWGSDFPAISVSDQVHAQAQLLDHLGIEKLHAVIGPSVGGLMTLCFAALYPQRVSRVIPIASGFDTTVLTRLTLLEQILAIENDANFNAGNYYGNQPPELGLALARMISHKTFVHLDAIESSARNELCNSQDHFAWYTIKDKLQSYMLHQGKKFVKRFDANTYLRVIDMWSSFRALEQCGASSHAELAARFKQAGQRFLVFSIDSDFCFYPEEQGALVKVLEAGEVDCMHITVHSNKGHDSFLLEPKLYIPHITQLLES